MLTPVMKTADFLYIGQKALGLRDWWRSFTRPVLIVPYQTPLFRVVTPLRLFVFDAITVTITVTILYPEGDVS